MKNFIIFCSLLLLVGCINKQEVTETLKDLDEIQEDKRYFLISDNNFLGDCNLLCYDKKQYVVVDDSFCSHLDDNLCDGGSKVCTSRSTFKFLSGQGQYLNEVKDYWEDRLK